MNELSEVLRAYKPSGRVGARAIRVTALWGTLSALLIGALYLWARSRAGGFISAVVCDLVFLPVIAVTMRLLFRHARSRSPGFNRWVAAMWAGVMLMPWWWSALEGSFGSVYALVSFPLFTTHTPTLLAMAVECVVLGCAAILCAEGVAKEPYSEIAQSWASDDFTLDKHWEGGSASLLVERIRTAGIGALLALQPASDAAIPTLATRWRSIRIEGCKVESDPAARWLRIAWIENRRKAEEGIGNITEEEIDRSAGSDTFVACVNTSDYEALRTQASAIETTGGTEDSGTGTSVPKAELPIPVELEKAVAALECGNHTSALTIALRYCEHADIHVRSDANRMAALCLARLERWDDAFMHYEALYQVEPTPFNALQLASTSVMAGEVERGKSWFRRADESNQAQRAMEPVELRTGFLSALEQAGHFAECVPHLEWLLGVYRVIGTTDSHRLFMYRVPPFEEFLAKSRTILQEVRSPLELRSWYRTRGDGLPDEWRLLLAEHIRQLM